MPERYQAPLGHLAAAGAVLAFYWLTIFIGTHLPVFASPVAVAASDKGLHFLAFGGLAFLVARFWRIRSGAFNLTRSVLLFALLLCYAAFDELTQPLVGRDCSFYDWVADAAGAAAGLVAYAGWRWLTPPNAEFGLQNAE